jgi:MFS transporter, SP family, solute carrier family 2 (myo-inositol transporter), member 13
MYVCMCVCVYLFCFAGYDTGVISGALLYIKKDFDLDSFQQEVVVSTTTAGAMIGALAGSRLTELGRRLSIVVAAVVFTIGAFVMAFTPSYEILVIGRAIVGFGIGVASMSVPMYVAEVAPSRHRGALVSTNVLFITGGQFVSYLVDSAFANVDSGWRWMLGLSAVPAVIQIFGMMFLPESPHFLVRAGRISEARSVLARIEGVGYDVERKLEEIQANIQMEEAGSWSDLFSTSMRRPLIIAVGLQAFQQLVGINTAMYYSPTILKMAGFTSDTTAIMFSDAVAFSNMVMTVVAMKLIDTKGRRKLLLVSGIGIVIGLIMLSSTFYALDNFSQAHSYCGGYELCTSCVLDSDCGWCAGIGTCLAGNSTGPFVPSKLGTCQAWSFETGCGGGASRAGFFAVASLVFYVGMYAVGFGCVPWAVMSEIFPVSLRSKANSIATATNWTCNLIISLTFLTMTDEISKAGTFLLFTGLASLAVLFVWRKVPETKGRSIEQLSAMFENNRI